MDKAEFIQRVENDRSEWNDLLAQVDDESMLKPGIEGAWSTKDILAHVMWYEREMIGLLNSRSLVGSDLWELSLDERNAEIHKEIKDMSLDAVRKEAQSVFTALIHELNELPEDAYGDPAHFLNMPSEWKPWDVFSSNTFRHYREHTDSIRRLAESGLSADTAST